MASHAIQRSHIIEIYTYQMCGKLITDDIIMKLFLICTHDVRLMLHAFNALMIITDKWRREKMIKLISVIIKFDNENIVSQKYYSGNER